MIRAERAPGPAPGRALEQALEGTGVTLNVFRPVRLVLDVRLPATSAPRIISLYASLDIHCAAEIILWVQEPEPVPVPGQERARVQAPERVQEQEQSR